MWLSNNIKLFYNVSACGLNFLFISLFCWELFLGFQFPKQYFAYKINQNAVISHFLSQSNCHFCVWCLSISTLFLSWPSTWVTGSSHSLPVISLLRQLVSLTLFSQNSDYPVITFLGPAITWWDLKHCINSHQKSTCTFFLC